MKNFGEENMNIKNIFAILLVSLLSMTTAAAPAAAPLNTDIVQPVQIEEASANRHAQMSRDATVKVVSPAGHGSGTYVKVGKFYGVVTAAHVVQMGSIYIIESGNTQVVGHLVWKDEDSDLAFLWTVKIPGKKTLRLTEYRGVQTGEEVIYSGFPSSHEMLTFKCSVANADMTNAGVVLVQGFAWFGASGSGFINKRGQVFAVLSAVSVENFYGHPQVISAIVIARTITKKHINEIESALDNVSAQGE